MMRTVSDASGAVMPKAQVSIKNVATGEMRTVTTNAPGLYTLPHLLPGSYDVTATAPGFATEIRSSITLTVGAQQSSISRCRSGRFLQKLK
jgi:hypothetical protein